MKRFTLALFTTLALLAGFLMPSKALASHAAGGELTYTWVSDSTYTLYFKFYRDCFGTTEPASVTICYTNSCNSQGGSLTANKMTLLPGGGANGSNVVTPCPGTNTTCNGGSIPGYKEWWYSASVTLPSRCDHWTFFTGISARNAAINNLVNPGSQYLYIEATLNNLAGQGSSSPYFTVKPVPYVCINNPYTYNNGAVDPNNDSLTFEEINPRTWGGSCSAPATLPANAIPFVANTPAYNTTNNPFSTGNTYVLNSSTGQMSFTPDLAGPAVVTIRVNKWRNGTLIGTVLRDIQIVVISCTNPQPTVTPVSSSITGAQLVNGRIVGCANQPLSFCVDLKSPDTNAVLVVTDTHTQALPGSTLAYTGMLSDSVRACVSWLPGSLDTGLHILTLTVKDSNCTGGGVPISQTFNVPVYIWPVTDILKDTTLCPGDSIKLIAVGGGQFIWTVLPGGSPLSTLSCTNCSSPIAHPTVTTKYVVTSNLTSICNKNKDTVTITVAQVPVFNLGPDTTTCINNSLQLNTHLVQQPGAIYQIKWVPALYLNNDTINTPITRPKQDITYVVTVTPNGQNRCSVKDTIKVTVLQGYKLWNKDTAVCKGATINVNATGDTRYNFTWTPAIGVSNTTLLNPAITPDTSRRYTIKASYPGCTDSVSSFFVDVQPVPTVYVGPDRTLCFGDTLHLKGIVTPSNYGSYTYTWTPGGGLDDASAPNPVFTGIATTTITLTVKTPAGCSGSDDATLSVIPANFLSISSDTALCPGDSAHLRVTGVVTSLAWSPNMWISDTTGKTATVWPVTTTQYTVIGKDINRCSDTVQVTVEVKPAALLILPDTVTIYPGESYQMDPGGNCLYFSWFPPLGLSNPNIANPVAMPDVNTRYFINAMTEFGCRTSDSMDVQVADDSYIDVPNAFTPGSQPNAVLYVVHKGRATLNSFTIYNRWGVKVFQSSDIAKGWDGTFNGQTQPMGVYVYVVDAVTSRGKRFQKQGNITLIR